MFLNLYIVKLRLVGYCFQFIWLETSQNRERAVFTYQPIVQKQMTHRRIEKICNCVPMQINYEETTFGHAIHFAQNINCAIVIKVMQGQRLNHIDDDRAVNILREMNRVAKR